MIIGIDLGTTNSVVSIMRNGTYEIIPDEYGNRTIPSIVSFTKRNMYIGYDAKNQLELNPENTYNEVKRLIGRKIDEEVVQNDLEYLSYNVSGDSNGNIQLKLFDKKISPEEISAYILKKLKKMAEEYLKCEVSQAVITVPAYFSDTQRAATRDAAKIAGLDCIRIINEPTAAALIYGIDNDLQNSDLEKKVLVYDFGGGTLDTSILNISDGIFEVLASTGNTHLGGADFDNELVSYCKKVFMEEHNLDELEIDAITEQTLRKKVEFAKRVISSSGQTMIMVENFYEGKNLVIKMSEDIIKKVCAHLFLLCLKPIDDVLRSAEINKDEIDEIILVGGSTKMKILREYIGQYFHREVFCDINPDEVISAGAAVMGYILQNSDDPFSKSILLMDVIPLSIGIALGNRVMSKIIHRNQVIPIRKSAKYTTEEDDQTEVIIEVYESERQLADDNYKLGEFILSGIEKGPRGFPIIEVNFDIDVDGIIRVSAIETRSQSKSSLKIKNIHQRSEDEIEKMIEDAYMNSQVDDEIRNIKELISEIDLLCSNIRFNIKNENKKNINKEKFLEDIMKTQEFINNLDISEVNETELKEVIEGLKKRFGILIFTSNYDIKGSSDIDIGTTLLDEDIEELSFTDNLTDIICDNKEKIKEKKIEMIDELNNVSMYLEMYEIDNEEYNDFIDDMMLWIYTKEKIRLSEIDNKFRELSEFTRNIYEQNLFEYSKKDELELLICNIKLYMENSYIFIEDEDILKDIIISINEIYDKIILEDVSEEYCIDKLEEVIGLGMRIGFNKLEIEG